MLLTNKSLSESIRILKRRPDSLYQKGLSKYSITELINYIFKNDDKKDFYTTKDMLKIATDCYIPTSAQSTESQKLK